MVTSKRWKIAQKSEKEYWGNFTKEDLLREETERHKRKAETLKEQWKKYIILNKKSKILQIGCGPEDIINYLNIGNRYAIDPLADFYKEKFKFDYGGVKFLKARGEKLPFKTNFFDIVVLTNVLDHTENPKKALLEIKRVLKQDGIFYFENFFYQKSFINLSKIWGFIKKLFSNEIFNVHHPYMFTLNNIKDLISSQFKIIYDEVGKSLFDEIKDFKDMKYKKIHDKKFSTKILARFGIYGIINYNVICKKSN